MCNERSRRGFTLIELVLLMAVVCVLLSLGVGTLGYSRDQSSVRSDIADLREIAQASAMYSEDYQDRLFTFSWKPGEVPDTPNTELAIACGNLNPANSSHLLRAAVYQQLDIVSRNTEYEQITPTLATAPTSHTPYAFYNHLVLAHYLGESLPSEKFTSAGDRPLNYFHQHMDKYFENPQGARFRPPSSATNFNQLWRWPFSSSYMTGPSHYSNDIGSFGGLHPITASRVNTTRNYVMPNTPGVLGTRTMNDVAYPSLKVQLFDEYDRYSGQFGQYFSLEDSASTQMFYDGGAGRNSTASSNYGFFPNRPDRGAHKPTEPSTFLTYIPISGWDPPDAAEDYLPVYYDQTRDGLQGIDFSPGSIRQPVRYNRK